MKKNLLKYLTWSLSVVAMLIPVACSDDAPSPDEELIASFSEEVDATNFAKVTFTNISKNAVAYVWDFGDNVGVSVEESPVYEYQSTGTFTVKLTAANAAGETDEFTKDITITDPDEALTLLAGTSSKTWIVQRQATPMFLGPNPYSCEWWCFTDLATRTCILDDEYTFERAGGFTNDTKGTFFLDAIVNGGWNDAVVGGEGCVDETDANAFTAEGGGDYSAFANGGSYTYEFNTTDNTLKLNGEGAYIALTKLGTNGDIGKDATSLNPDITYTVHKLVAGDVADSLHLMINDVWTLLLVSYHSTGDIPDMPVLEVNADFSVTNVGTEATFKNLSNAAAVEFAWDFGDNAGTSTDENPVYTYAALGDYSVTLTTKDAAGTTATVTKDITIANPLTSFNIDFESDAGTWAFTGFEGASDMTVVDNPDGSGKVGEVTSDVSAGTVQAWSGIEYNLGGTVDFTTSQTISMDVRSPFAGAIMIIKLENSGNADDNKEVSVTNTAANTWETLSYTFAAEDANKWDKMVIFFNMNPNGDWTAKTVTETHQFDNLKFGQ